MHEARSNPNLKVERTEYRKVDVNYDLKELTDKVDFIFNNKLKNE